MEGKITRIGKNIMTVMLSLVMIASIFVGMKLDVWAATNYIIGNNLAVGKIVKEGDTITFPAPSQGQNVVEYAFYDLSGTKQISYEWKRTSNQEILDIPRITDGGITYNRYKVDSIIIEDAKPFNMKYAVKLVAIGDEEEVTPAEKSNQDISNQNTPNSHTCNFEWVTTIDPTTGADGLEEYKCASCGLVKESHPIPASVAAVKDFYGNIKEAPENGSITYDSGKLYTISDYLLKKMSERSDVSVTVSFEYQNAKYELTFPAGTDYTPVLEDEDTMYGYFGVAARLGLTVETK
mgnify:FL=1